MNRHYSEEDLALHYYGEGTRRDAVERHLASCASCAALYREVAATLTMIAIEPVPARDDQYGLEVWQRIRRQLPEREADWFKGFNWFNRFALAAGVIALVVAAFMAGQYSRRPANPVAVSRSNPLNPSNSLNPLNQSDSRRILLTAVADHLDRSERVLTEVMNATASSDISVEQQWAEDLLTTSRLYRQDAVDAGEVSIAAMLDDLERNLVEIVHSPSRISAADLEQIRRRIDAAALLFKVRVMSDELRQRETAPPDRQQPHRASGTIG